MEPRPHERGKCIHIESHVAGKERFNGATSSRTWKGGTEVSQQFRVWRASMEPRPHERGKAPTMERNSSRRTALQWSHVLTNVERLH